MVPASISTVMVMVAPEKSSAGLAYATPVFVRISSVKATLKLDTYCGICDHPTDSCWRYTDTSYLGSVQENLVMGVVLLSQPQHYSIDHHKTCLVKIALFVCLPHIKSVLVHANRGYRMVGQRVDPPPARQLFDRATGRNFLSN